MLEGWSEVDKKLAKLGNNVNQLRMREGKGFAHSMKQEFVQTIFYGNSSVNPEEFLGLSQRFSSLSANNGSHILDAGGAGSDNSSIWLICWDDSTVHGVFPKGSKAGFEHKDWGEQIIEDSTGRMAGYVEQWNWDGCLSVPDWRQVVRIANIDISNLVAKSSAADLIDLMIEGTHTIYDPNMGKCCFYMNRSCMKMLDIQRRDDAAAAGLTYPTIDGIQIPHFRGYPIRLVDQLTEAEGEVT
jgi:hypothetical protein